MKKIYVLLATTLFTVSLFGETRTFKKPIDLNQLSSSIKVAIEDARWNIIQKKDNNELLITKRYIDRNIMQRKSPMMYKRKNLYLKVVFDNGSYQIKGVDSEGIKQKNLSSKQEALVSNLIEKIELNLADVLL